MSVRVGHTICLKRHFTNRGSEPHQTPTIMPLATVAPNVQLSYSDSGAPADDVYTTVVVMHGYGWNGGMLIIDQPTAHHI
jgi:hypothetical protein